MASVISAIKNTVPISLFNRGQAGKIFEEVRQSGAKVVMKNNTAECVLLSPEEYVRLMDELNDAKLEAVAAERLARYDPQKLVSWDEMMKKFGVTEEDLAVLAASKEAGRKGCPEGAVYTVILNKADSAKKREAALSICRKLKSRGVTRVIVTSYTEKGRRKAEY